MPLKRSARNLLILILVMLAPSAVASAQGTDGVFPDPLDWDSFQSILEPLDLSPEQIAVLEAGHSHYLEVMMTLRDGSIADFMADHDRWFKAGDHDAESTKERINDYRRITTRFESNESNLFDAVEGVLGPSQVERLQIVRDWRDRQRKLGTPWPWQGYSPQSRITRLELRRLIEWDELDDDQRAAVEQSLAAHEGVRTRLARQLHEQRLKGRIREVEIEAELGPIEIDKGPETDHDEGWMRWQAAAMERHRAAYDDAIKTDVKLRVALHRGLDATTAVLPDRQARDLRWKAWTKAYSIEHMKVRPLLIRAIDNAPTDVDTAELELLLAAHDAHIRPIHERAVEYYDQQAAEEAGSFIFIKMEEEDSAILEIQSDLHDRNVETARAFHALLGTHAPPGLTQYLAAIDGEPGNADETDRYGSDATEFKVTTTVIATEDGSTEAESGGAALDATGFDGVLDIFGTIPDPISGDTLATLARDIGADAEDRDIIDMLHEGYATSAIAVQTDFERKQKAGMMKMATGSFAGQDPEKSKDLFMEFSNTIGAQQKESIQQLRGLDDQLFDDLVLAIEDVDEQRILQWHRLARQRIYAASGTNPMGGVVRAMTASGSMTAEVDFMNLLEALDLEHDARMTALHALGDWHEPATTSTLALAALAEAESTMLNDMMVAKDGEEDEAPQQAMKLWERLKESGNRRRALEQEARDRNEAAAQLVRNTLGAEDAARFDRLWRENIYPMIFDDPGHMGGKLMAAMSLDDLDEPVRAELLTMHDDYTRRYEACCDQMVVLMEHLPATGFGLNKASEEEYQAMEQAQNESERIRFERDDLSAKIRGRLKILLTEAQIQSIGGLKAPRITGMPWGKF